MKDVLIFPAILAVVAWLTLVLQLYLSIRNRETTLLEAAARYFSFFTILSSLLAALCLTALATGWGGFWARLNVPGTLAAALAYLVVVALVYNILLRGTWEPRGLRKVLDELLHVVIPTGYLVVWLIWAPKGGLRWADALVWMIFPVLYSLVVMGRGALTGFYPYPFLDPRQQGYRAVLRHAALMIPAILAVCLAVVGLARGLSGG